MKNIFKYMGVLAVAGTLGLQTLNVQAANTCAANEESHFDYYLFLNTEKANDLKITFEELPAGKSYISYNGAFKVNNIKGATIVSQGNVKWIYNGSSTDTEWTLTDFWHNWYNATNKGTSGMVYSEGKKNYVFHEKWWAYESGDFATEPGQEWSHIDNSDDAALSKFIEQNWNDLSSLINNGTMIPDTTTVTVPATIASSKDDTLKWFIVRSYDNGTTVPSGIAVNNNNRVYAPSAYYVEYCVQKTTADKSITYMPNTTDTVAGMPDVQTFADECVNLDSATPKRTGYSFVGWSKDATSNTATYQPGDEYCGDSTVLYAVWKATQTTGPFKVEYKANGGKDAPATQTGTAPSCIQISDQEPHMDGFYFLGWSTNPKAAQPDKKYSKGSDYCGELGDLTLYAVWSTTNPKTGVSAHLITFSIVAIAAVGALVVAKKKDLFKQI